MDMLTIKEEIDRNKILLEKMRLELKPRLLESVDKKNAYEKKLAVTMVKMINGVTFDIDGIEVKKAPASVMRDIAKGICSVEKIEADTAAALYEVLLKNIDAVKNILIANETEYKHFT